MTTSNLTRSELEVALKGKRYTTYGRVPSNHGTTVPGYMEGELADFFGPAAVDSGRYDLKHRECPDRWLVDPIPEGIPTRTVCRHVEPKARVLELASAASDIRIGTNFQPAGQFRYLLVSFGTLLEMYSEFGAREVLAIRLGETLYIN